MVIPRLATHYDRGYCADAAVHLLREREAKYPALVADGKLTAEASNRGLETARIVVRQWQWAVDPSGAIDPPWDETRGIYGFGAFDFELAAELAGVAQRARGIADREPGSWERRELADLCDALSWWQHRDPGAYTCRIVRDTSCQRRCAATIAARSTRFAA